MDSKAHVFVSFVVYVRNHVAELPHWLERIGRLASARFETAEIIIVDDASADGSAATAATCCAKAGLAATILHLPHPHGKERAIFAAADRAIGDFIFEFDGPHVDYPLSLLEEMFERSRRGEEVLILSPRHATGVLRQAFYRIFNSFSRIEALIGEHRVILFSRRAVNALLSVEERLRYRKALIWLTGFRIMVLHFDPVGPATHDRRPLTERISLAVDYLITYTSIGLIVPLVISGGFLLFSAAIIIYALVSYFTNAHLASGWTSLMLFLSISFSGLFLVLGILCEYVAKLLQESTNLPMYTIQDVQRIAPGVPASPPAATATADDSALPVRT